MKSRSLDGLSALKFSNWAYIAITLTLEGFGFLIGSPYLLSSSPQY